MVIAITGLPGSGKSWFAKKLSEKLNATYFNSDQVRNNAFSKKDYSPQGKIQVYKKMYNLAQEALKTNNTVVLDATFHKQSTRDSLKAHFPEVEIKWIKVVANETLIIDRLSKKRQDSDADYNVYQQIKNEEEDLREEHLTLESTNENINQMIALALKHLDYEQA
ncbi:AAA family ATPase [Cytophagaceae bacterium ABcell3]|nr:AAA family ATPase [Cytophagaceae bacterium ABcell3]